MREMFHSATLKLTMWYLMIIMSVSIAFSAVVYQLALDEFSSRMHVVQSEIEQVPRLNIPANFMTQVRADQYSLASKGLIVRLFYVNLGIFVIGGVGSYVLARRTLKPIEEANATQARFIADASHQLRTPLAIMKAELETAQRSKSLTKKDTGELITSSLEEVNRLSLLSQRLLELSHLDSEINQIELTTLSLDKLAKDSVSRLSKIESRINLNAPNSIKVRANQHLVEEVINILIDNAIKFSPSKSPIHISLQKSSKHAKLSITNQGDGIAKEDIDRVFERFYKSSKSPSSQGYGLGLSIAKKIIDISGGNLSVESQENGPTTFTVQLPLAH